MQRGLGIEGVSLTAGEDEKILELRLADQLRTFNDTFHKGDIQLIVQQFLGDAGRVADAGKDIRIRVFTAVAAQ